MGIASLISGLIVIILSRIFSYRVWNVITAADQGREKGIK